ncbi:hypothetical protein K7X08_014872 [Anisodus acutangulus]|uniref:Uncharacterized protein n=1 Tax=Anisodus acutangulus TaxID=402998 RepID=A0A9Q1R3J1_9SOLA|nr:hypothetical protein K7X08_014872 [Anisodus acutangulus]
MTFEGNADGKWSEKKMEEEEDSLRKVECIRGRLLAERVASRNAKEEAHIMGNKMIELETKLREETKSRNKAEKKLKFLIKKLKSRNISYNISDEISEHLSVLKSEFSSVTSINKVQNSHEIECQESIGSTKSRYENVENNCSEDIENDASQMSTSSKNNENLSAKSSEFEFSKSDANSLNSSVEEEEKNGGNQVDFEEDNSLALVPMDLPKTKQTIDPIVVREVLDALRHAKEKIETQMQRSQMIKAS